MIDRAIPQDPRHPSTAALAHVRGLPDSPAKAEYDIPTLERTRLGNGLEVIECAMPTRNAFAIEMGSRVGSQNETPDLAGATHFCEHMMCAGTSTPGRENGVKINTLIEAVGGSVNAYTGHDRIALSAYAPRKHAALALDLVIDRAICSTFSTEALEQQRGAILGEISSKWLAQPIARLMANICAVLYQGTPIAHHTLGTQDTVRSFTDDQLRQFQAAAFQPENLIVAIAGGYSPEFRQALFDTLEAMRGQEVDTSFLIDEPTCLLTLGTGQDAVFVDPLPNSRVVELGVVFPGLALGASEDRALALLHDIMGNGSLTCRINAILREQHGLTYGGGSGASSYIGAGHQTFGASVVPENVEKALPVLLAIIEDVWEQGISEQELIHAKRKARAIQSLLFEKITDLPTTLLGRIIHERSTGKPFETPEESLTRIEAVTLQQINDLARNLLAPEKRQIFAVGETTYEHVCEVAGV